MCTEHAARAARHSILTGINLCVLRSRDAVSRVAAFYPPRSRSRGGIRDNKIQDQIRSQMELERESDTTHIVPHGSSAGGGGGGEAEGGPVSNIATVIHLFGAGTWHFPCN